jgi:hypothetical protein
LFATSTGLQPRSITLEDGTFFDSLHETVVVFVVSFYRRCLWIRYGVFICLLFSICCGGIIADLLNAKMP